MLMIISWLKRSPSLTATDKRDALKSVTQIINERHFQEKLKSFLGSDGVHRAQQLMDFLSDDNKDTRPFAKQEVDDVFFDQLCKIKCELSLLSQHRISSFFSTHTESYKMAIAAIRSVVMACFPQEQIENEQERRQFQKTQNRILESDSFCYNMHLKCKDSTKTDFFPIGPFKRTSDDFVRHTHSVQLDAGGWRDKKYHVDLTFYAHVRHDTHKLLRLAKNPDLITSDIKSKELIPFVEDRISKLSQAGDFEAKRKRIHQIAGMKNFSELDGILTRNPEGSQPDDSPENREKIAYYILSRNRHFLRSQSHQTDSIKRVLNALLLMQTLETRKQQRSTSIQSTIKAIEQDHEQNPTCNHYPHIGMSSSHDGMVPFERIAQDKYVIHFVNQEKRILGRGGSKEAYEGTMVTVESATHQVSNMKPIVITKQSLETREDSKAESILARLWDRQTQRLAEGKGHFQYFHLEYFRAEAKRHTLNTRLRQRPQDLNGDTFAYTYQKKFSGTLANYPAKQEAELLESLIQISTALKDATECGIAVTDPKPENVFVDLEGGVKTCFLADMDDWLLDTDPDLSGTGQTVLDWNQRAFNNLLKMLVSQAKFDCGRIEGLFGLGRRNTSQEDEAFDFDRVLQKLRGLKSIQIH